MSRCISCGCPNPSRWIANVTTFEPQPCCDVCYQMRLSVMQHQFFREAHREFVAEVAAKQRMLNPDERWQR